MNLTIEHCPEIRYLAFLTTGWAKQRLQTGTGVAVKGRGLPVANEESTGLVDAQFAWIGMMD